MNDSPSDREKSLGLLLEQQHELIQLMRARLQAGTKDFWDKFASVSTFITHR